MHKFWGVIFLTFLSCPVWAGTPLVCIQNLPQEIQFGQTYNSGTALHKMTGNVVDYEKANKGAGYSIPYMNTACISSVHIFKTDAEGVSLESFGDAKTVSSSSVTNVKDYSVRVYTNCSAMFRRSDDNRRLADAITATVEKAILEPLKNCLR